MGFHLASFRTGPQLANLKTGGLKRNTILLSKRIRLLQTQECIKPLSKRSPAISPPIVSYPGRHQGQAGEDGLVLAWGPEDICGMSLWEDILGTSSFPSGHWTYSVTVYPLARAGWTQCIGPGPTCRSQIQQSPWLPG